MTVTIGDARTKVDDQRLKLVYHGPLGIIVWDRQWGSYLGLAYCTFGYLVFYFYMSASGRNLDEVKRLMHRIQ